MKRIGTGGIKAYFRIPIPAHGTIKVFYGAMGRRFGRIIRLANPVDAFSAQMTLHAQNLKLYDMPRVGLTCNQWTKISENLGLHL